MDCAYDATQCFGLGMSWHSGGSGDFGPVLSPSVGSVRQTFASGTFKLCDPDKSLHFPKPQVPYLLNGII